MAIIAQSARYGSGLYGTSEYGVVNLTASISGVSATGTIASVVAGGFEVDVTERISTGVSATGSVGTLNVFIKVTVVGVSATGTVNTVKENINTPITGVQATGSVNTVEEKPTEALDSVSATGSVNNVTVNIIEKLGSVSATGTIATLTLTGTANVTPTGVEAVGFVNTVEEKPTEVLNSVSATVFVNGNFTFSNTHSLTGVSATSTVNTVTATGVIFDFEAVKALYDRKRTVLIEKQAPRIVYVKAELPRIVYVDRQSTVAERRAAA